MVNKIIKKKEILFFITSELVNTIDALINDFLYISSFQVNSGADPNSGNSTFSLCATSWIVKA